MFNWRRNYRPGKRTESGEEDVHLDQRFKSIRRRVWVAIAGALAGVAVWVWWARGWEHRVTGQARVESPFVQLALTDGSGSNEVLRERAELLDPTSLFFPTEWNYGERPLNAERLQQPGRIFGPFAPRLTIQDQGLDRFDSEAAQVPERPWELLRQGNEAPFAGYGHKDRVRSTLPVRAGFLEVRRLGDSQQVKEWSLTGMSWPRQDFAPMEFLIIVGPTGMIGEPIMVSGSGWEEVDAYARSYLLTDHHLGERLSPGRYRVCVGG